MSENKKPQNETETILMALDQISQTIDVMTSVVGRLKTYLREHEREPGRERSSEQDTVEGIATASKTVH
jgi:argininosuccinate lyase